MKATGGNHRLIRLEGESYWRRRSADIPTDAEGKPKKIVERRPTKLLEDAAISRAAHILRKEKSPLPSFLPAIVKRFPSSWNSKG